MISKADMMLLAEKIRNKIRLEFNVVHLSKNLMNTIKVYETSYGYEVEIPAEIYDIKKWFKEGVIVYTGKGSYAQAVNETGGWSESHNGYVECAIASAIQEW